MLGDTRLSSGDNGGYWFSDTRSLVVQKGNTYIMAMTPGYRYGNYQEYWSVWLDSDMNDVFRRMN